MNPFQRKAVWIALQVLKKITLSAGQSERQVSDWIKAELKNFGAKPSFRSIVASGKRSAFPHGYATRKKIKAGEQVVVDFGARYNGYCSDLTRTFIVGQSSAKQRKIIQLVKKAQQKALRKVREGAVCREIDKAARDYFKKKGLGKYFIHTTGHGIGRKVHQEPRISSKNRHRLKAGQVVTVEPGIYIRGWGGVRREDMFLVTKKGCKLLT